MVGGRLGRWLGVPQGREQSGQFSAAPAARPSSTEHGPQGQGTHTARGHWEHRLLHVPRPFLS